MLQTDGDYVNIVILLCYGSVTILISSSLAGAPTPGAQPHPEISYQRSDDLIVETAYNPVVTSIPSCSPLPLQNPIWYESMKIFPRPFLQPAAPSEPHFLFFSLYQSAFVASFR